MAAFVLDEALKLLHPFMPFVTEELWAKRAGSEGRPGLLMLAPWPEHQGLQNAAADAEIGWVIRFVSEVRSVRAEMNVPAGAKVPLVVSGASAETEARVARHEETLLRLARLDGIAFGKPPTGAMQIVLNEAVLALPLAIAAAGFLVRLFAIQHDCSHGAFFRDRLANDWFGRIAGVLTFTPYDVWRRTHATHHASTGNLDRRGLGDVDTLTVDEYRARSFWGRLRYRLYRHPLVMFGLGPAYVFILPPSMPQALAEFCRQPGSKWPGVRVVRQSKQLAVGTCSRWA
jgi:hypothetical protein